LCRPSVSMGTSGFDFSGRLRAVRHVAIRCWRRRWRARDEGQGCAAPAKPAGAKHMSLTRVSSSRRKCCRQRTTVAQGRLIKPEHVQLRDPWSEPDCVTRSVFRAGSNSHTVAARSGCTPIPRAPRQWLRRTRPFWSSALKPNRTSVRSPGIRPDRSGPGILGKPLRVFGQAAFITAPSTTTPVATYFHSATSSLRARATMVVFFMRPPSRLTRSWNQRDSADCGWWRSHSQAS
jgi:hypothetical protein